MIRLIIQIWPYLYSKTKEKIANKYINFTRLKCEVLIFPSVHGSCFMHFILNILIDEL